MYSCYPVWKQSFSSDTCTTWSQAYVENNVRPGSHSWKWSIWIESRLKCVTVFIAINGQAIQRSQRYASICSMTPKEPLSEQSSICEVISSSCWHPLWFYMTTKFRVKEMLNTYKNMPNFTHKFDLERMGLWHLSPYMYFIQIVNIVWTLKMTVVHCWPEIWLYHIEYTLIPEPFCL